MEIAFDIGGVIGKYQVIFIPMMTALAKGGIEVYIVADIPDKKQALSVIDDLVYSIDVDRVLCADYSQYSERCKAVLIKEYGIDVLVDDHPGFCADSGCICRLSGQILISPTWRNNDSKNLTSTKSAPL
jgi:hypothetical protein